MKKQPFKKSFAQVFKENATLQATAIISVGALIALFVLFLIPSAQKHNSSFVSARPLAECSEFQCYADYFAAATQNKDAAAAFTDLKKAYESDGYVKSQCHQLAHIIGRTAFDKYGSLQSAFPKGDSFCWSGYHHGIVEQAIGKMGGERIKAEGNDVCRELAERNRYSFDHYNCVHGLGHGFMSIESYNLFKTLNTCDILQDNWDRQSCYGGAFMENVMIEARGDGKSQYLRSNELMYPCTAVDEAYKQQCYLMQTSYALQQNGYNFAETFVLCRDVADKAYITTCYQSIGRDASGSTVSDITLTTAHCRAAPDYAGLENCMLGAVRDFISYYHSDVQARQLCQAFEQALAPRCLSEVESYYKTF